jgi:hypothetical protein
MDLMLAASAVGPSGKAIGIDMTEAMAERLARPDLCKHVEQAALGARYEGKRCLSLSGLRTT